MTSAGYDGSIRIDTKIDEKGFNTGISKMGNAIKGIGKALAVTAVAITAGFLAIVVAVFAVVSAIGGIIKSITNAVDKASTFGMKVEGVKDSFAKLKASLYNAFTPLMTFALPLIQRVVDWLSRMLNIIAMFFGALMGQKEIMVATASAAESAADATGKTAKNTKDSEKAAKGALAAFDEINVLQQKDESEDYGGGGGSGTQFSMVPITQEIQSFVENIKNFFEPLKQPLLDLWDALKELWEAAKVALAPIFEWAGAEGKTLLEFLRDLAVDGIEWLTERIKELTEWIEENPETFRILAIAIGVVVAILLIASSTILQVILVIGLLIAAIVLLVKHWPEIAEAAKSVWTTVEQIWFLAGWWFKTKVIDPVVSFFTKAWETISGLATSAWNTILQTLVIVGFMIKTKVIDPLVTAFQTALDWIKTAFTTIFEGVKGIVKNAINAIIGFINSMISAVTSGVNAIIGGLNSISITVPEWVPQVGGMSWGINLPRMSTYQIPKLATGAVIPPNSEFLAVLGDQRAGRNIEAPEGLIRQIIQEELGSIKTDVEIKFGGSLGALVRELKPYIDRENVRIGGSLIKGGIA